MHAQIVSLAHDALTKNLTCRASSCPCRCAKVEINGNGILRKAMDTGRKNALQVAYMVRSKDSVSLNLSPIPVPGQWICDCEKLTNRRGLLR